MSSFVHLQTHSEYSMLMGAARIKDLIAKAKGLGQTAIALTDHGNMFGTLEFYTQANKAGLKPILGCDTYFAPDDRLNRSYPQGAPPYHKLILLAQNNTGYKNLLQIVSDGHLDGFYQKPRIDWKSLEGHTEGLLCLTSNYQGQVGHHLLHNEKKKALALLEKYREHFGFENVFLCLQSHGMAEEEKVNASFLELHQAEGWNLLAVNDVHYVEQEESDAHDVLLCIDGGWKIDDTSRPRFHSDQYFLKSSEAMAESFQNYPGAVENTVRIAERCNVEIEFGNLYHPVCPLPEGFSDADDYLAHLSNEGMRQRYQEITPALQERLDFELRVMKEMKVAGYMLIVQDFIVAAKKWASR